MWRHTFTNPTEDKRAFQRMLTSADLLVSKSPGKSSSARPPCGIGLSRVRPGTSYCTMGSTAGASNFLLPTTIWLISIFFHRVNASPTILSLISAYYYYYFVTEKTGRGIEITTRRVTYFHGIIYFPQLQEACDRQRTSKGRVINQAKENVRFLWYIYGILIRKCVECMIITAVTHYGPQTRNNQQFCSHTQYVFIGWGWSLSVPYVKSNKTESGS